MGGTGSTGGTGGTRATRATRTSERATHLVAGRFQPAARLTPASWKSEKKGVRNRHELRESWQNAIFPGDNRWRFPKPDTPCS